MTGAGAGEAGYTLVEMMVALAMIGLAIGGLSVGVGVIGRAQWGVTQTVTRAQATRTVQTALERALGEAGAFRAQDGGRLTGDATEFEYACGAAKPCKVVLEAQPRGMTLAIEGEGPSRRIRLDGQGAAHFAYQGSSRTSEAWPPGGPERQALRAILLVADDDDRPLMTAKLWSEQPGRCDFDVVMQDCR